MAFTFGHSRLAAGRVSLAVAAAVSIAGIGPAHAESVDSAGVKLPLVVGGVGEKIADPDYLASRRVRVWSAGHDAFAAGVQAVFDTMKAVRDGTPSKDLRNIASGALMARLTRATDYDSATRNYLQGP